MTSTQQIANDLRTNLDCFRLGLLPKVIAVCFRCSPQTAGQACALLAAEGLLRFDGVSYWNVK